MLGGLLKPNWQHKLPEKRLQAVEKMAADSASQNILASLAAQDPDLKVRLASINKLNDLSALFALSNTADDADTSTAARQQFCKLIGPNSKLSDSDFDALLNTHPNADILLAEHCPNIELRHRLLAKLDQGQMADLIANVAYIESRKFIAEQLSELSALEVARKNLKGKDKSSEKIIRQKLDLMRANAKLEQENNAAAAALCEQLEFIANHPEWRAEFKDRFQLYQQRWAALDFVIPQDSQIRFESATQSAQTKVDQQTLIEDTQSSQRQLILKLEQYCASLAPLAFDVLAQEKTSINSILSDAIHSWLKKGKTVSPASDIEKRFSSAQKALASVSELISAEPENFEQFGKAIKQVSWPSNYLKLSALEQAGNELKERKTQTAEQRKELKDNLDKLHKRINRLIGTTNKGDIKKAKYELSATTKAATNYHGKERKILDERLKQAAETVSKMSDWQAFATEPKLLELCEQMEALTTVKTHPDKLSTQISALQNQWKGLAHSDITDTHWPRFKAAADIAYEPCGKFFEQRKQTRAANLAKREPLLARTQALLDNTPWNAEVDYKQVEIELRDINNDWRKVKDVERRAGQKQWERLGKIKDAVYAKLDVVYDANIELKQQIIQQVSALSETKVDENAVAKLQLFQSRWKQVGVTRRKQDQEAWTAFKAASDKVYAQVQDLRKAKRSEQDEELDAYRKIINAIANLSKSASDLNSLDKGLTDLQTDYTALPAFSKNIPEKLVEKINDEYKRALNTAAKANERLNQSLKTQVQSTIKQKAELCTQLEALSDQQEDQIADLSDRIKDLVVADKSIEQRFEKRLADARVNDRSDFTEARRVLCIELEILLDVESPELDRSQRMQMQLKRMQNKGLGLTAKSISDLQTNWWCLPGAEPSQQAELQSRFDQLLK